MRSDQRQAGELACARNHAVEHQEPAGAVEEDGGGEADRVDAVEHSAVAFDQRAAFSHWPGLPCRPYNCPAGTIPMYPDRRTYHETP
jgi:hypothetical protein